MSIKIPSGPPQSNALDAVKDAADALQGAGEASGTKEAGSVAGQDAVSRIAEQVARGEITRNEAVQQLIAQVIDSDIIKSAPEELSKEIGEALNSLLETDPYLKSLSAALGPINSD